MKKADSNYITHIARIHLEDYKSIKHLTVEPLSGINIIIGKNNAGKTNFLEGLRSLLLLYSNKETPFSYAEVDFINSAEEVFTWTVDRPELNNLLQSSGIETTYPPDEKILLNGKTILDTSDTEKGKYDREVLIEPMKILSKGFDTSRVNHRYVRFNLTNDLTYLEIPDSITISDTNKKNERIIKINSSFFRYFSSLPLDTTLPTRSKSVSDIKKAILAKFQFNAQKEKISNFSPIEDFRLNKNLNVYWDGKAIKIENLLLEFKVDGIWMPWSRLSDGTKRIFYLLHEVASIKHGVVLIDEPEIGIHPHQFHEVMQFLKQESEEKQIILSTHAPQALDFIAPDELKRIFIATYSKEKGTLIKPLSAEQRQKALAYMNEELFLRDYWIHSDLEV